MNVAHEHSELGQKLRHSHPEDGFPHPATTAVDGASWNPAYAITRADQVIERIREKHPRAARDGDLAAMLQDLRDELGMVVYARPVYQVTRGAVEEMAGREVSDEEISRVSACIEFSTVADAVRDAVAQVIDLPDDEEDE